MTRFSCYSLPALCVFQVLWSVLLVPLTADGLPVTQHRQSGLRTRHRRSAPDVALTSRTGYCLAIRQNGTVYGSDFLDDQNAVLVRRSIATARGIVVIEGVHSGRFMAINSLGRMISTANITMENHFFEIARDDGYSLYKSRRYQHYNWYLGLTRRGNLTKGNRRRHENTPIRNSKLFMVYIR